MGYALEVEGEGQKSASCREMERGGRRRRVWDRNVVERKKIGGDKGQGQKCREGG